MHFKFDQTILQACYSIQLHWIKDIEIEYFLFYIVCILPIGHYNIYATTFYVLTNRLSYLLCVVFFRIIYNAKKCINILVSYSQHCYWIAFQYKDSRAGGFLHPCQLQYICAVHMPGRDTPGEYLVLFRMLCIETDVRGLWFVYSHMREAHRHGPFYNFNIRHMRLCLR